MNRLLANIIARSRTVLSTLVFLLIVGAVTYGQMPKEAEPELDVPVILVNVALEGVSPLDAERLLVRPLEEQLSNLEGLKELRASAFQGGASVTIEFDLGTDIDVALREVRNKVDLARPEMPMDVEEPQVDEARVSMFPMAIVALSGNLPERTLFNHARELEDRLMTLPGVFDVELTGTREEMVEIAVDPARVQSYGLNVNDLTQVFSRANRLVAAGRIDTGRGSFSVTVPGLFESVDDILMMPVKSSSNAIVRVRDIADIRRTFKDADSIVRLNGRRAIALEAVKRYGFNIIDTTEDVKRTVARVAASWPAAIKTDIIWDGTRNVKDQYYTMQNSVILAIFLVMAIVIGVLGLRSGLLVGIAIPGSFLTGLMVLNFFGVTVSMPVMFGLLIAVGMLVDGAIVIVEYADRKMAEGLRRKEAFVLATQRMAWPTISSTMTTVAAFFPLLLWPGMPGQMLGYLPKTLISVLSCSLIMALIFVPTLGALIGRVSDGNRRTMVALSGSGRLPVEQLTGLTGYYVRMLELALRRSGVIVAGTVVLLLAAVVLYSQAGRGFKFFPDQEPQRAVLLVHALGNLGTLEKARLIEEVEDRIRNMPDFENLYTQSGLTSGGGADDVIGKIVMNLKYWAVRRRGPEVLADVQARVRDLAGVQIELEREEAGPTVGRPIVIELSSLSSRALYDGLLHVRRGMNEVGGFTNEEDSRPTPGIKWQVQIDRPQAARFGADLTAVGSAVRMITNGVKLGAYRPDDSDDEIDIMVRFTDAYRSLRQLDELRIRTDKGLVPISNFVRRVPVPQETTLSRVDRRRVMTVEADVETGLLASAQIAALQSWLETDPVGAQVRLRFRGEAEQSAETGGFLLLAFPFALFLMAGILLVQFNSFYSVFLILSSVILSTIGVLLGHVVLQSPFYIVMSGIGVFALAGIVVNNNIVLIDTYDRLIKTAPDAFQAIVQTGAQRLRPVLLTTATTAFGLFPMALGVSIDFLSREIVFRAPATLWWQMLAVTIIMGLLFASILTLVVTPCALMLRERRRGKKETPPALAESRQPTF